MKQIIRGLTFLFAAPLSLLAQINPQQEIKWDSMDLGAFQSGTFKVQDQIVAKGIAIKVGAPEDGATILFDPELMRISAAWTGGFIRFPRGRGGLEGQITPEGTRRFSTAYAPGWNGGEIEKDPRPNHQGNLPPEHAKWHGLYTNGENVVLHYAIQKIPVLELPGYEKRGAAGGVFTRTIQIGKSTAPLTMLVADVPGGVGSAQGTVARLTARNPDPAGGDVVTAIALNRAPPRARLEIGVNGRVVLRLPELPTGALFQVVIASAKTAELPGAGDLQKAGPLINPATLTKGGTLRWGVPLVTTGTVAQSGDAPYVVDDVSLPDDNPFRSWLRPGGHDFFPNGTVALVNVSGDVWIVGGLDDELQKVTWKRFATGLSQPLGCKVVDGKIHVLGRDQITRLHDLNNDGEADYYENFNNDCVATDNYHEFALDLQTDSKGDFFYAKGTPWTPTNTSPHQGTLIKVTKDGRRLEVFATGLRAPNGLGIGPRDELTVSDNQGHWIPANRLNLVKRGGFYGMTPSAHRVLTFRTVDGQEFQANPSEPAARTQFKTEFWGKPTDPVPVEHDLPLCWIPMQIDNSSGGQVWVPPGDKWGPLAGRMLFLSYGKCALFTVFSETVDGQVQGGLCRLPLKFTSGIMRARFSPRDGQLYLSGLNVWQSSGAKEGCFQRVRYTGRPATLPVELHALEHGVALKFTAPLDPASATDLQNFSVERWNYSWTGAYGSPDISIADPKKKGRDLVFIDKLTLSPDRLTLTIALPEMSPAMQMRIKYKFQDAAGQVVAHEIHNTIHRLPGQKAAGS